MKRRLLSAGMICVIMTGIAGITISNNKEMKDTAGEKEVLIEMKDNEKINTKTSVSEPEEETEGDAEEATQEIQQGDEQTTDENTVHYIENVVQQPQEDWVKNLSMAQQTNQMIIVAASGSSATVSMHEKGEDGIWRECLRTSGFVGRDGVGTASEYAAYSPRGAWGIAEAFGNMPNPGTSLAYTQVDDSYYWVDDVNSVYYNKFVTTKQVAPDWNSAEHIQGCGRVYNYVLALNYNVNCIPGAGSAFFLHCSNGVATAGCVAIPEGDMIQVMQKIQPGCVIIIDTTEGVRGY